MKKHKEVKHGDAVFIVVAPDVKHLKVAKGLKIYEIDLY